MKKTTEQRKVIFRGTISLIIGIIIGVSYSNKFVPFEDIALLTVWGYFGWMFAALAILYGLCEIFIKGDL